MGAVLATLSLVASACASAQQREPTGAPSATNRASEAEDLGGTSGEHRDPGSNGAGERADRQVRRDGGTDTADGAVADDRAAEDASDDGDVDGGVDATAEPEPEPSPSPPARKVEFTRLPGVTTVLDAPIGEGLTHWRQAVPRVEEVEITSTVDGTPQPAMWLPPGGGPSQPLIIGLHSWSYGYAAWASSPFARWADQAGWGFIHPHMRGPMGTPESTGSDLAVADVLDALDFALAHGDLDPDRVFLVGYSGGGMMSLLMAARHPDRFAGAAAWGAIHDLADWYRHVAVHNQRYAREIRRACGGDPLTIPDAARSCEHRSPSSHLDATRRAGTPVFLGHGVDDTVVPPAQSMAAFSMLGDAPPSGAESFFGPGDPPLAGAWRSGATTLVLYEAGHDMVYHPSLEWMANLAASSASR